MSKKISDLMKRAIFGLHEYCNFSYDRIVDLFAEKNTISKPTVIKIVKEYEKHLNYYNYCNDNVSTQEQNNLNIQDENLVHTCNEDDINKFKTDNQNNEKSILDDENNFERLKNFIQKYDEILNLNMSNKEILNAANKIKSDIKSLPKEIQDDLTMEKIRDTIKELTEKQLSLNKFLDIVKYNLRREK